MKAVKKLGKLEIRNIRKQNRSVEANSSACYYKYLACLTCMYAYNLKPKNL